MLALLVAYCFYTSSNGESAEVAAKNYPSEYGKDSITSIGGPK